MANVLANETLLANKLLPDFLAFEPSLFKSDADNFSSPLMSLSFLAIALKAPGFLTAPCIQPPLAFLTISFLGIPSPSLSLNFKALDSMICPKEGFSPSLFTPFLIFIFSSLTSFPILTRPDDAPDEFSFDHFPYPCLSNQPVF